MSLFKRTDWNGNGKEDLFDSCIDMENLKNMKKRSEELENDCDSDNYSSSMSNKPQDKPGKIYMGKKEIYDPSKDSDWKITLKCFLVSALCVGAMVTSVVFEAGPLISCLLAFGSIKLSFFIFKNL